MTYDEAMEHLRNQANSLGQLDPKEEAFAEAVEIAEDAITFTQGLHQAFKDNGMTTTTEPSAGELENLIDALYGELGAAVLFLCEPSLSRVPDMLRGVEAQLSKAGEGEVPPVVLKGFGRLASRIENTRVTMQQLAMTSVTDLAQEK